MDQNPYQSPSSYDADAVNVKVLVRLPALGLIFLALLTLLLDVPIAYVNFVDTMRFIGSYGFLPAATLLGLGTALVIVMHLIVLIGAIKMRRLTGYGFARGAAIISLGPLSSPGFILGIPFGIWAIVALSKNGVREAFSIKARN